MVMVPTGLATAWHNSGQFWVQTGMAVARHPLVVLVCAAVPAAERAYLLLETRPIPAWKQSLLEGLVTLWRILLCVGMVWVAVSGERWQLLRAHFSENAAAQTALQRMGTYLGDHLGVTGTSGECFRGGKQQSAHTASSPFANQECSKLGDVFHR